MNNNVRTFKLVKEPLFKSSYMVSNLKLVGRKLTGLGGAVALTSSMISGITPSMSASTDALVYDAGVISLFKEIDDNRYTGTIELDDDDDSYIKGIILDEHFDKSLDSEDNIYTDDYYDNNVIYFDDIFDDIEEESDNVIQINFNTVDTNDKPLTIMGGV